VGWSDMEGGGRGGGDGQTGAAGFGEPFGQCQPEAATAARDDEDFAAEVEEVAGVFGWWLGVE